MLHAKESHSKNFHRKDKKFHGERKKHKEKPKCKVEQKVKITNEIGAVSDLGEIKSEIQNIEAKLDNPCFGLAEIKREIRDIEAKLDNPSTGLAEIKREIQDIEAKLDNPLTGLAEIKREIQDIEAKLDRLVPPSGPFTLTTGPVIRDGAQASNLLVKVLNNTTSPQTVVISVFNLAPCPKTLVTPAITVLLNTKCADERTIDLGTGVNAVTNFEVEISGVVPDVFAFVSTQVGGSTNLQPSNTFRHAELVRTTDP